MQTKIQSMIEAWVNIILGYGLALTAQIIVFPLYGMQIYFNQNIQIGIIFTVLSLARSYGIRRLFDRWHK